MAYIKGTSGKDTLKGTNKSDQIYGYGNDDSLHGRWGNDYLNGGAGNDSLSGDAGNDRLAGGTGSDSFKFAWQMGNDAILDFNPNEGDQIKIYDLPIDEDTTYATNFHWLAPQDVNYDGRLDAVLSIYSQQYIDEQRALDSTYEWDYEKDTVAFLGWAENPLYKDLITPVYTQEPYSFG